MVDPNRSTPLPVVNHCGECTACCTVLAIAELDKPSFQDCHFLSDCGCSQYATRPSVCRAFECKYLSDGWGQRPGGEMMRPDRCGLLVYGIRGPTGGFVVRVSEVVPGTLRSEIGQQLIAELLQQAGLVSVCRHNEDPYLIRTTPDTLS